MLHGQGARAGSLSHFVTSDSRWTPSEHALLQREATCSRTSSVNVRNQQAMPGLARIWQTSDGVKLASDTVTVQIGTRARS